MNEFMALVFFLLAGVLLGLFFFAGLWWTVRKIESSKHVGLLFLSSLLLRTSVAITGFYFILGDNWLHLLTGLIGFIIARIIVTWLTRFADQSKKTVTAGSL